MASRSQAAFTSFFFILMIVDIIQCQLPTIQTSLLSQPVVIQSRPYSFGFEFGDGLGMTQYRHESADSTGLVKGTYGYLDPLGVYRTVDYNAGVDGFKAFVRSNEPGLSNHVSGDVTYVVQRPTVEDFAQSLHKRILVK